MSDIPNLSEIQETFLILDNWEDRYAYLIDLGRKLPDFPECEKTPKNIVEGCTSQVWIILSKKNGRLFIQADSDAHIVRGLIALVVATYNNLEVAEILKIDMKNIFADLGLSEHLSPNRRNGFFSMVERIRLYC